MQWPRKLVFMRHGLSEGNILTAEARATAAVGTHDFALAPDGRMQVQAARQRVMSHGPFDQYYCSTYNRTQESHHLLFPGVRPIIDSRLNELGRGIWSTMPSDRRSELYPHEEAIRDRAGNYHYRAPGGENGPDVELRIHSFLTSLRADHEGQTIMVSAHGNWMLYLWRVLLNKTVAELEYRFKHQKYPNTALAVYTWNRREVTLSEQS